MLGVVVGGIGVGVLGMSLSKLITWTSGAVLSLIFAFFHLHSSFLQLSPLALRLEGQAPWIK
jgi:hypothetical protein